MFRPKRLEQMDCGPELKMVSASPISHIDPGSGSNRNEIKATNDTNRTNPQELVAVPGPKAGEKELGFMGLFGLDGSSDKYTEGTKGTLYLPMGRYNRSRISLSQSWIDVASSGSLFLGNRQNFSDINQYRRRVVNFSVLSSVIH